MEIEKGTSFVANGPIRVSVEKGSISSRGLTFGPTSPPLVVRAWEAFDLVADEDSSIRTTGGGQLVGNPSPYPPEWNRFLVSLPDRKAKTIMILGDSDTGKSTMCILAANRLLCLTKVHIVDGDVGQSDIGPPTTVGLGELGELSMRLSEANLLDAHFVGDTSPAYCFQEVVSGAGKMAEEGRNLGGSLLLDTCGLVTGSLGQRLASEVIEASQPELLILLERESELGYLQDLGIECVRLPALSTHRKNWEARRAFRISQFLRSMGHASSATYDMSSIRAEGCLARRGMQRTDSVLHASDLKIRDLCGLEGTVVGMYAGEKYLDIGILEAVIPNQNRLRVLTDSGRDADHMILGNILLTDSGESRLLRSGLGS